MRSRVLTFTLLFVLGLSGVVRAEDTTITFLDDYELTGDIEDIIRLGDRMYDFFYRPTPQDVTWTFNFDVSSLPQDGEIRLFIDHADANLDLGYIDYIYINGIEIGTLSDSEELHWYTEEFVADSAILHLGENSLYIEVGAVGGGVLDDIEFTNLYLEISGVSSACAGTVEASTYQTSPVYSPSQLAKHIGYLILPLGAVILMRILRRKR